MSIGLNHSTAGRLPFLQQPEPIHQPTCFNEAYQDNGPATKSRHDNSFILHDNTALVGAASDGNLNVTRPIICVQGEVRGQYQSGQRARQPARR